MNTYANTVALGDGMTITHCNFDKDLYTYNARLYKGIVYVHCQLIRINGNTYRLECTYGKDTSKGRIGTKQLALIHELRPQLDSYVADLMKNTGWVDTGEKYFDAIVWTHKIQEPFQPGDLVKPHELYLPNANWKVAIVLNCLYFPSVDGNYTVDIEYMRSIKGGSLQHTGTNAYMLAAWEVTKYTPEAEESK